MKEVSRSFSMLVFCVAFYCGAAQLVAQGFPATSARNITVTINPTFTSMGVGGNQQFSATVQGSANKSVQWEVNGVTGGNAQLGTIDSTGLYIAPVTVPTGAVTVSALAIANKNVSASAPVSVLPSEPLGTVTTSSTIKCPMGGLSGATCYSLQVHCPGVTDFDTYVKVNKPVTTSLGTVIFGTGTGGANLYDLAFTYGSNVVQKILNAGFTTAQISFGVPFTTNTPNGWLTGPGGVRRLACRYTTAAQWIYNNIHNHNTSAPICATGNSGGAGAIAYALAQYGAAGVFSMVELTSGPPMARLDYGCLCTQGPQQTPCGQGQLSSCYASSEKEIIDSAYPTPLCSNATPANSAQLLSDSVLAPGSSATYSNTLVHVVFGGQDNSAAVPQGLQWFDNLSSSKSGPVCVADAPHDIPDVLDGAMQIANDVISNCHLQ